jgi:probable biosynthetic protein (TIGR04099 family)
MNTFISPIEIEQLLSRSASANPDVVVLGMPHLCMTGLSEIWLLKECGHRHWGLLAAAAGRAVPDFRDPTGEPIYAAFLAVSLRDARLDAAREHDALVFSSRLARNARTQFTSLHRMAIREHAIGEVAMTSAFVRRAQGGTNHTIARVDVPGLQAVESDPQSLAFAADMASLRANDWSEHLGLARRDAAVLDRVVIDPCPSQDFNGADFLYFASFQAFVDRAEWSYFRSGAPFPTTRRRDIVYRGNIDPGERVLASLMQCRRDGGELAHWYRLEREHDGLAIADAFTLRGVSTRA